MPTPEEIKKAEETAAAEAKAKAEEKEKADADFEAEIADLSEEEKEAKRAEREALNTDNQPDYKAIAEEEERKRIAAEKKLADKRFKDAEKKRKAKENIEDDEEDDLEDDEDKPLTKGELSRILDENTRKTERRLLSGQIKKIAEEIADSPEEARAIISTHANRSWPEDVTLEQQLEETKAIVNRKRINSVNSELKRALKSKITVSKDTANAHRDGIPSTTPKVPTDLKNSLAAAGFIFDVKEKVYKKTLPNGKILVKKDAKSAPYIQK